MSFWCAAGIALCFAEERRKQCAMCAAGGKKYDRKNNEGLGCGGGEPCGHASPMYNSQNTDRLI